MATSPQASPPAAQATTGQPAGLGPGRPPPGLARGRWEAPAWVFWALIGAAALGSLAWTLSALRRLVARRKARGAPARRR